MNSLLPLTSIQNIPHHNLTLQTPFALKKNLPPHHLPAKRIPLAKCLNAEPKIFYSLTLRLASVCTIIRQTKDVLILMVRKMLLVKQNKQIISSMARPAIVSVEFLKTLALIDLSQIILTVDVNAISGLLLEKTKVLQMPNVP